MAITHLIPHQSHPHPSLDTAVWFLQLRWVAVCGQLLTMAVVIFALEIPLPYAELLSLIGITAATNLLFWQWLRRLQQRGLQGADPLPVHRVIPALMLLDVFVLTGMLYLSAGIANPFALFYFVNVAVAGAIVAPAWAWTIWVTTVLGVAFLLVRALPIEALSAANLQASPPGSAPVWTIPKLGFLAAFATCSGVILYFITALTVELRRRELAIQEAEEARLRNRQLEGLATLAAGAAHELSTPLSTIAVVATELGRALEKAEVAESVRHDVQLIRSELDQCRLILDRMTSAAGDAAGERWSTISLSEFIEEILVGVRNGHHIHVEPAPEAHSSTARLPVQAAALAVRNLVQNAIDAGAPDSVRLAASATDGCWVLQIADRGAGMSREVLERIGEPFFTTKEPGRGMGLGIYLTQNVLRRLGGSVEFSSQEGVGTTVRVVIPIQDRPRSSNPS